MAFGRHTDTPFFGVLAFLAFLLAGLVAAGLELGGIPVVGWYWQMCDQYPIRTFLVSTVSLTVTALLLFFGLGNILLRRERQRRQRNP